MERISVTEQLAALGSVTRLLEAATHSQM